MLMPTSSKTVFSVSRLTYPPPRTNSPTAHALAVATSNVLGAKRAAKARPNMPACIANSFASTAGPTTRNTSRGSSGTIVMLAATNASASEHNANTTARAAITTTPRTRCAAKCSNTHRGTTTCSAAAAAAPNTKYDAA